MATDSQNQRSDEAQLTSAAEPVSPSLSPPSACATLALVRPLVANPSRPAPAVQTVKIDSTDSQNVDSSQPPVNGDAAASSAAPTVGNTTEEPENKHLTDIVDDLVNSTEVSISGGSDNEAAKSDASKTKSDAKPKTTLKKPTTFKAVNVNKTFLTSKGTTPSSQAKAAEKSSSASGSASGSSSTTSTNRPRLIAKTGGVISKSSTNGKPGSAPDPNAVWNKNRRRSSLLTVVQSVSANTFNSHSSPRP